MRSKLLVIVGPTASGKSEFAVRMAKELGGEIISADSRQVYRGLDIGTGKVTGVWRHAPVIPAQAGIQKKLFIYKSTPHHCIDFVSSTKTYTVAEFKKCAEAAIQDITKRGKIPILVGGTGFWIDAVVYDLKFPGVPPNPKLRKKLEKKSPAELFKILQKLDPRRAKTVESKNPRRLIRAIEIVKALGEVPKLNLSKFRNNKASKYNTLWIGIKTSKEDLRKKIHKRLLQRMRAGMIGEAKKLRRRGLSWRRFYKLGLEYRFLADHLRGKLAKKEMTEKLERAIVDYARRQMTWWRRNPEIRWLTHPLAVPVKGHKR